jgi:RNA polymerase sigma-70 factor, ECF subfamily
MIPDRQIIDQILHHDRRTLHYFYHTYTPKLAGFIRSKIDNSNDAEEILQDTLISFIEAARDWSGKSNIQTYIFSICNHKIVDYYRRKKIKQIVFSQIPQLETIVAPFFTPEDELEAKILRERINRTLNSILPHYKKMLLSKYMDNLSIAEIAQKFTGSVKSIESKLGRAKKAFVKVFVSI